MEGKTQLKHIEKKNQLVGPFTLHLNNKHTNNWRVSCKLDYEILICNNSSPSSVIETFKIDKKDEMHLHKKEQGGYYYKEGNYLYLIFSPGYPNGTQAYADVRAPWTYVISNKCKIPKNGAVIVRCCINSSDIIVTEIENKVVKKQENKRAVLSDGLNENK